MRPFKLDLIVTLCNSREAFNSSVKMLAENGNVYSRSSIINSTIWRKKTDW